MNRNRILLLAFLAITFSVLIAFLAYRTLRARLGPTEELTQIVVAVDKLPLGTRLAPQNLRLASWPKAAPLEGSFSDVNEAVGRGVIVPLSANEPVLESKLASREAGAGLATAIPEGMRAVSVRVNEVIGVAGFVLPGTRVDVIAVGTAGKDESTEVAKVFLQNVQVLTAGQNVEQDASGKPQKVQVVTLLVTPEDSQKLALALVDSRIQLALRNPLDLEESTTDAANKGEIYGGASKPDASPSPVVRRASRNIRPKPVPAVPVVSPPPPRTFEVELIKGDKREIKKFESSRP